MGGFTDEGNPTFIGYNDGPILDDIFWGNDCVRVENFGHAFLAMNIFCNYKSSRVDEMVLYPGFLCQLGIFFILNNLKVMVV